MTIKVIRGNPTPEELAAVVALLTVAGAPRPGPVRRRTSAWTSRRRLLRTPHAYGPAGWLASALPH
ncbi:acyl-CoA carboxylase subunit epsilon [Streptomyces carpinensis]|uniref:acyl-CoA carboxylase subunit epsilon n=1 Tax=Streptomyces carpinensis TaxID=66369 RepID=UPI000A39E14D|nr:acyl-CoA carboxylase subunit epsilon [Streptomyces carpinensis]